MNHWDEWASENCSLPSGSSLVLILLIRATSRDFRASCVTNEQSKVWNGQQTKYADFEKLLLTSLSRQFITTSSFHHLDFCTSDPFFIWWGQVTMVVSSLWETVATTVSCYSATAVEGGSARNYRVTRTGDNWLSRRSSVGTQGSIVWAGMGWAWSHHSRPRGHWTARVDSGAVRLPRISMSVVVHSLTAETVLPAKLWAAQHRLRAKISAEFYITIFRGENRFPMGRGKHSLGPEQCWRSFTLASYFRLKIAGIVT